MFVFLCFVLTKKIKPKIKERSPPPREASLGIEVSHSQELNLNNSSTSFTNYLKKNKNYKVLKSKRSENNDVIENSNSSGSHSDTKSFSVEQEALGEAMGILGLDESELGEFLKENEGE